MSKQGKSGREQHKKKTERRWGDYICATRQISPAKQVFIIVWQRGLHSSNMIVCPCYVVCAHYAALELIYFSLCFFAWISHCVSGYARWWLLQQMLIHLSIFLWRHIQSIHFPSFIWRIGRWLSSFLPKNIIAEKLQKAHELHHRLWHTKYRFFWRKPNMVYQQKPCYTSCQPC